MALRSFREFDLQDFAAPAMAELRERTGETVYLVSLDGNSGLVVDRVDAARRPCLRRVQDHVR